LEETSLYRPDSLPIVAGAVLGGSHEGTSRNTSLETKHETKRTEKTGLPDWATMGRKLVDRHGRVRNVAIMVILVIVREAHLLRLDNIGNPISSQQINETSNGLHQVNLRAN